MESKVCVVCNTEKSFESLYKKCRECKPCKIQRIIKSYYENRDRKSDQRKIYYEENRDVILAKSHLNQQNGKSHTQQMKDL